MLELCDNVRSRLNGYMILIAYLNLGLKRPTLTNCASRQEKKICPK